MKKLLMLLGVALSSAAHSQTTHYTDSALYAMSVEQLREIYKEHLNATRGQRYVVIYGRSGSGGTTTHTCSGFTPHESAYIRSIVYDYPTEDSWLVWRIRRLQLISDK